MSIDNQELIEKNDVESVQQWLQTTLSATDSISQTFQRVWNEFIKAFGCRCHGEIDLSSPRWEETPSEILRMAYQLANEPIVTEEMTREQQAEAWETIQAKLSWRSRRKVIQLLPIARIYLSYREHHKYGLIRVFNVIHRVLKRMGERLASLNLLDHWNDVFCLHLEDLLWWEEGRSDGKDFRDMVQMNRTVEGVSLNELPRMIVGPECMMCLLSRQTRESLRILPPTMMKGMPTSPGVVEGVAVVATDPATTVIRRGEILVARATDPGWTPLFVPAGGVAIEIGCPLNHGSVVAKELGIPCVVGAVGLMKKVKSGMRIRVDGNQGIIEILSEE